MNIFGERLRAVRKDRNFTTEQVAQALGITRRAYVNYEAGTRQPTIEQMVLLADLLNVSLDYLVGRTDDPTPPRRSVFFTRARCVGHLRALDLVWLPDDHRLTDPHHRLQLPRRPRVPAQHFQRRAPRAELDAGDLRLRRVGAPGDVLLRHAGAESKHSQGLSNPLIVRRTHLPARNIPRYCSV